MKQYPEASTRGIAGEAGFTLFEILVAMFILSVIFSSLFASYTGTLKMTREWEDTGKTFSMARGTMDRMLKDFESAYPSTQSCPFDLKQDVINEKPFPRLSFYTCSRINSDGDETSAEGISRITYAVRLDPETGGYELARIEYFDTGTRDYVICRGLSALSYRFYDRDGKDISDNFCAAYSKSRPASVVLDLTLANPQESSRPFHFTTRVHPANLTLQES
jgi:general secretion pathway protein J